MTVIGGQEEESEDGVQTLDIEFLTVLLRGFDCEGNLINDRAIGTGDFTYSPSLQQASVTGTVISRDGREIAVDLSWDGTGPLEVTQNTTTFPGFTGHFVGMRRDAVATGTVVVDGATRRRIDDERPDRIAGRQQHLNRGVEPATHSDRNASGLQADVRW